MTEAMFRTVVEAAGAKLQEGVAVLPERHLLTLHLAHEGAALAIGRLVRLELRADVVSAEDDSGELFFASLGDVFAASVTAPREAGTARKAGFLK